jgi:hypothetical protein
MDSHTGENMNEGFEFVDRDRTFTCSVEAPQAARAEAWWWFRVSTEPGPRYAPFRRAAGDTRQGVQSRIVAYYDDLLLRRALPAPSHWRRRGPVAAGATTAPESSMAPGASVAQAAVEQMDAIVR